MPAIVEAEAVDHGAVADEPEDPGLRIARLRLRRQRAHLGETRTQTEHGAKCAGVLVESGGNADRIGEH